MLRKLIFLLFTWILWLATFAVGKVGFMLYNQAENPFGAGDVLDVLRHGLSMDMTTAAYLVALPWLYFLVVEIFHHTPKRRLSWGLRETTPHPWHWWLLHAYAVVAALVVVLTVVGDACLYPFWKFKLNAIIFTYLDDTAGVTNSVSGGFIAARVIFLLVVAAFLTWAQIALLNATVGSAPEVRVQPPAYRRWVNVLVFLLVGALDFLAIRGGIGTGVQNVGTAYYSQNIFLNHSAVNPAFSLASTFKRADDFGSQFRYFDEKECQQIVADLLRPTPSSRHDQRPTVVSPYGIVLTQSADADALLTTERPNVLIVLMEGFGGKFVEALGGLPEVAPNFNRLVREGVFFTNYYSTSFRTDRGTASLLSGNVSYPTTSLMRLPDKLANIPGLARSLSTAGYTTHFLYGGDITFAGTQGYLVGNGFDNIVSDKDFSPTEAHSGKWGVCDSITAERALMTVAEELPKTSAGRPWLLTYQTLSSHEPFEVDYQRLDDPRLNAFAYTDACIDRLIAGLKASPAWDNLLVILVPDHGFLLDTTYEDPEFFHCPMLWLGGAVKAPRQVDKLMSQSDVCATLLGQLNLKHDNYPWSRDVFSPDYKQPFVYSTFPGGILFRDSTGTTVYDINSDRPLLETPAPSAERAKKAKALLQYTYTKLAEQK